MRKLSLDMAAGEHAFQVAAARHASDDHSFLLAWANSILESAGQRLAAEYTQRGNMAVHTALCPYLSTPIDHSAYQELSQKLGMSASALRVALHRLRQRFGETLREVVGETVEHPDEVDQELQELLLVLTGKR